VIAARGAAQSRKKSASVFTRIVFLAGNLVGSRRHDVLLQQAPER
jgi:hypothetical protein